MAQGEASMELKQVLGMKKGDGENSYVKTSLLTQKIAAMSTPMVDRVVQSLFRSPNLFSCDVLNIADLACSSGPNTFLVMSTMLQSIANKCSELKIQIPEIQFYLTDLPSNDFNTLFKGLSVFSQKYVDQYSSFFAAVSGSYHGRIFPRNKLHLAHCSYGPHWFSRVPRIVTEGGLPLNRGKIYISKTSPFEVRQAYLSQFQEDFLSFLKSRSLELVPDGLMLLVLPGRESEDPTCISFCYTWDVLSQAIAELVKQGLIEEEKLDSFNVPLYAPWQEEVREVVEKEGSFTTEHLETMAMEIRGTSLWPTPEHRAKDARSFTESMISAQFGEDVTDKLYDKFKEIQVASCMQGREPTHAISIVLVLRKKIT
ncbi:hypothetical protein SLE2022_071510 [Rubroshorea leprosula]